MTDRRDQAIELFAPLGPSVRPPRRAPLVRPGPALAAGDGRRASRGTAAACSTSRPAPASSPSGCSPQGHRVTGLDQSPDMLAVARQQVRRPRRARRGVGHGDPVRRRLVRPPHVHLPAALRRRSRPRRWPSWPASSGPGGTIANLEFCVPRGIWRPLWDLYVGVGLPALGRLASTGWYDVGRFLGPSIRGFYERVAARAPARALAGGGRRRRAGPPHERRRRRRDLGHEGVRPAFYALRPGRLARLRDAAPRAVHGLAPLVRRRRRLPRRRGARGAGSGSPCSRSSSRWASAPTRSTSSRAGRCRRRSRRASSSRSRSSRSSPRARSGSQSRSASASGSCR